MPELKFWSLRLVVRTQDFHSCNRGSIPLGTIKGTFIESSLFLFSLHYLSNLLFMFLSFSKTTALPIVSSAPLGFRISRSLYIVILHLCSKDDILLRLFDKFSFQLSLKFAQETL